MSAPVSLDERRRREGHRIDDAPLELVSIPQVPDGEYEAAFLKETRKRLFGRDVWILTFELLDGPGTGERLDMYVSIPSGRPRRSWKLWKAFCAATGLHRAAKDLARRRPSTYLAGCHFLVQTAQATHDADKNEVPEEDRESRVVAIVQRTGGTPPCLRREPRQ